MTKISNWHARHACLTNLRLADSSGGENGIENRSVNILLFLGRTGCVQDVIYLVMNITLYFAVLR